MGSTLRQKMRWVANAIESCLASEEPTQQSRGEEMEANKDKGGKCNSMHLNELKCTRMQLTLTKSKHKQLIDIIRVEMQVNMREIDSMTT